MKNKIKILFSFLAAISFVTAIVAQDDYQDEVSKAKDKASSVSLSDSGTQNLSSYNKGNKIGLTIGLGLGFHTDLFSKGATDSAPNGASAGGGALEKNQSILNEASSCASSADTCSASGTGTATALNAIGIDLNVQYDIMSWLFVRTGFSYAFGLKNTYTWKQTSHFNAANGDVITDLELTIEGSQLEVPLLVGINFLKTDKSTLYFAVGMDYNSASYTKNLTATETKTSALLGTATKYEPVENKITASGFGPMWLVGGKVEIAENISIFGEVKFLSASSATGELTGTTDDGTGKTYADSNTLATSAVSNRPKRVANKNNTGGENPVSGLNFSYTRWSIGASYGL